MKVDLYERITSGKLMAIPELSRVPTVLEKRGVPEESFVRLAKVTGDLKVDGEPLDYANETTLRLMLVLSVFERRLTPSGALMLLDDPEFAVEVAADYIEHCQRRATEERFAKAPVMHIHPDHVEIENRDSAESLEDPGAFNAPMLPPEEGEGE